MMCACSDRRYGSIDDSPPCSFHLFQSEDQSEDKRLNEKSRVSEALVVSFFKLILIVVCLRSLHEVLVWER